MSKSTKEIATWWLVHAAHWSALIGAFALHSEGVLYLLKFGLWIIVLASPLLLLDDCIAKAAAKPPNAVREPLSRALSWATLGLMVWHGHLITGTAWAIAMFIGALFRSLVADARRKLTVQVG